MVRGGRSLRAAGVAATRGLTLEHITCSPPPIASYFVLPVRSLRAVRVEGICWRRWRRWRAAARDCPPTCGPNAWTRCGRLWGRCTARRQAGAWSWRLRCRLRTAVARAGLCRSSWSHAKGWPSTPAGAGHCTAGWGADRLEGQIIALATVVHLHRGGEAARGTPGPPPALHVVDPPQTNEGTGGSFSPLLAVSSGIGAAAVASSSSDLLTRVALPALLSSNLHLRAAAARLVAAAAEEAMMADGDGAASGAAIAAAAATLSAALGLSSSSSAAAASEGAASQPLQDRSQQPQQQPHPQQQQQGQHTPEHYQSAQVLALCELAAALLMSQQVRSAGHRGRWDPPPPTYRTSSVPPAAQVGYMNRCHSELLVRRLAPPQWFGSCLGPVSLPAALLVLRHRPGNYTTGLLYVSGSPPWPAARSPQSAAPVI
jgi:hypothetical protein